MSDGRLIRHAVLLALLVLAPVAGAATPATNRNTADSADGQDITDLAIDPTGQFVAAVVAFDAAKTSTPGGILGGTPAPSNSHKDLYVCDYGTSDKPNAGTGCRGLKHQITGALDTYTPNSPQHVDATFIDSNGRQGRYAVAGPDGKISMWSHTSDTASWSTTTPNNRNALNITIASDASRVAVGVAPTTGAGAIEVRHGNNGTLAWSLDLRNAADQGVRPTSLDYSRTGSVLAIGTSNGLLLANPDLGQPTGQLGGISQADSVNKVMLSGDGKLVAVAASNGVFLANVDTGSKPSVAANSVFNRGFGEAAQDVAISVDGTRFAAAAGNKIYFFRHLATSAVAEPVGTAYDAGARVTSIDYDEKGQLLVAVAGNNVIGFGTEKNTPLWTFDATQTAFGSLDGPLRKVAVSDDAQRIIIAGKTKTMAYSNLVGVNATLASATGATTIAPTQVAPLALTIKNTGSLNDNFSFVVTTPVGWPSTSATNISLAPNETGTVTFNVTAPVGQAPGVYGVQVRVRSQVGDELAMRRGVPPSYISGPAVNLTIPRSVVLNVSAPDDRLLLRQGGEQTIPVTLRNEGNAEGIVNLSTRQALTRGASWDIRFEGGDQVRVPPSSSTTVNMVVTAPSDAGSGDRNVITIRAREGETVEANDEVTAYVDAQFGAEIRANKTPPTYEFFPGQTQSIKLNITNIGNTEDTYNLTTTLTPATFASDWRVTLETDKITIARGQTKHVLVSVKAVASDARDASLTIGTISQSSPDKTANTLIMSLTTIPRPPTEPTKDKLLPAPGLLAVALVAVAVALVSRGGRR